jgi:ubiquinone/menaquinone biosynthesis C-methylase UbiE
MPSSSGSRRRAIAERAMTSAFDLSAGSFEHHRSLPTEAPAAIRSAIWTIARIPGPARVLDLGAGTGRIGRAFVAAGDFYAGVDTSLAMLREFSAHSGNGFLALADGRRLPFKNGAFDVVLLMHVLSGVGDWQSVLHEARRVLRPGGCVAVGHTVSPESGVDAQLKRRLRTILEEMGVAWHQPRESRRQALAWLEACTKHHTHSVAATWTVNTTAREFLERRRTGARFADLPSGIQKQALDKLYNWAESTFGSLDAAYPENRIFELNIFEF